MSIFKRRAALTALLTVIGPAAAAGQQTCPADRVLVTSLGIGGIRCDNCTLFNADPRETRWEFGSEPVVEAGIEGDTGVRGLRPGDVIIAIDGHLITTFEGGRRYARPESGRPAQVRIRRAGSEQTVSVQPKTECAPIRRSSGVVGIAGNRPPLDSVHIGRRRATAFVSPGRPVLPSLLPSGYLGMSFQCSRCQVEISGDSIRTWNFAEPPTVVAVEGRGPAASAGIRNGDRIVSIGGVPITSSAGGQQFGAVAPGETVVIGYQRGSGVSRAEIVAGSRGVTGSIAGGRGVTGSIGGGRGSISVGGTSIGSGRLTASVVRYTGRLGDTMIEVTGEPVTVDDTGDEIVIRSSTVTVRLRRDGGR